jgi:hypothetical protein
LRARAIIMARLKVSQRRPISPRFTPRRCLLHHREPRHQTIGALTFQRATSAKFVLSSIHRPLAFCGPSFFRLLCLEAAP